MMMTTRRRSIMSSILSHVRYVSFTTDCTTGRLCISSLAVFKSKFHNSHPHFFIIMLTNNSCRVSNQPPCMIDGIKQVKGKKGWLCLCYDDDIRPSLCHPINKKRFVGKHCSKSLLLVEESRELCYR